MDAAALRASFPVLDGKAYLNAGTCGPVPTAALRAAGEVARDAAQRGRSTSYFEQSLALRDRVRDAYAQRLRARPADVALTTATSDGIGRVLVALGLGPGDEVVTTTTEHPGLFGPLIAARARGVEVRAVPLAQIGDAVGPRTRLVACSHVDWITGACAPDLSGLDVPVLLDGAQGVGAVDVDVQGLGCAFYAGSGQKWLCGPIGTGMLWIAPAWRERLLPSAPTYLNLGEPAAGLRAQPWPDARAHDAPAVAQESWTAALAAHDVLGAFGWPALHERASGLAARLAADLEARGFAVAPRGATTLVSWEAPDAETLPGRLAERDIVVRGLPGTPYVRASLGAWNDEHDLARLLDAL